MKERALSYVETAVRVLRDNGRPMTSTEITEEAIRRGLLKPSGKTPERTMSAALYTRGESVGIKRLADPGPQRAVRGTVRWTLP